MTALVVGYDTELDSDETMARQMISDLCQAYPGHPWFVTIRGGVVHVKNMDLPQNWGMCLHYTQMKDDATERKKQVVMAAGEYLERARLKRGAKTEEKATSVEGIAQKYMLRNTL